MFGKKSCSDDIQYSPRSSGSQPHALQAEKGDVSWEKLRLLLSTRVTLQNFKVQ